MNVLLTFAILFYQLHSQVKELLSAVIIANSIVAMIRCI